MGSKFSSTIRENATPKTAAQDTKGEKLKRIREDMCDKDIVVKDVGETKVNAATRGCRPTEQEQTKVPKLPNCKKLESIDPSLLVNDKKGKVDALSFFEDEAGEISNVDVVRFDDAEVAVQIIEAQYTMVSVLRFAKYGHRVG